MAKRNKANEMSVEELIGNGMTVSKKFDVDPDIKNEFGMLLAQISQRYPSTSALRDAELQASVQHFVSEGKKGTRGTYELAEGTLDKIDLSSDMFIVDGIRIKMSNVYHLEVPGFDPEDMGKDEDEDEDEEQDEDERGDGDEDDDEDEDWDEDSSSDEYRSQDNNHDSYSSRGEYYYVEDEDGITHRLTAAQWNELERIREAQRRQMERDMENMRRNSGRKQRSYAYDEDGNYIPSDDGYEPDEEYQEKYADINDDYDDEDKPTTTEKKAPKTIGWLPPEKRKKEPRRKNSKKNDEANDAASKDDKKKDDKGEDSKVKGGKAKGGKAKDSKNKDDKVA